jgi:sugar lactone lactonase YvrE
VAKRAVFAIVLLAVASFAVWKWLARPKPDILEAGWEAAAVVLAGDGVPGVRDGAADGARFSDPFGIAAAAEGTIYVSDAGDAQRIRRIAADGTVSTLAGGELGYADGPGPAARFSSPSGLAVDAAGTLYVADTGNNMIRRVAADGSVSTLAGSLMPGYRDGSGLEAQFNGPLGVAVDRSGRVIVADTYNDRIRAIGTDGLVVTLAGSGQPGAMDGPPGEAQFDTPSGVAVDAAGNVFVADTGNGAVRMIGRDGAVTTVGPPPAYGLVRPIGIVAADSFVYVTDDRGRIIEIKPGVSARTLAGSRPGFADGRGESAQFRSLAGLALVRPGHLVVAEPRHALVRTVAAPSRLAFRPPASPLVAPKFDADAFAAEPLLWPLHPMEGPFEITGTLGESRGGEGTERFHAGLDVHAAEGTEVRAVRNGIVSGPLSAGDFGTLNESIRIGPITYVHLRVGRYRNNELVDAERFVPTYDDTGRLIRLRVRRGARFTTSEVLGTANAFNHVHLNVGWPGEEHNPLRFRLVQFEDSVPPNIARGGVRLLREDGSPITQRVKGRLIVDGRVHVVVDAWDQVNGNERRRRLGLYRLGFQVLDRSGAPAPGFEEMRETIRFDRLAPVDDAARAIYAAGSGIPFFGRRSTRFLYTVTSTLHDGIASAEIWDTGALPPGDYTLRVLAEDIMGNQALANRDLPITIAAPAAGHE